MIKLPQVTLVAVTGLYYKPEEHKQAIKKCCEGIEFGAVKVIMDSKVNDVDDHNKFLVYDLWKYIDTEFLFLCHADGYIINPELWNPKWLEYDFAGSPWPLPTDDYSYRTPKGELIRVGNSVGLRSRRLMKAPTKYGFEWKSYYGNTNEDGFFCVHNRKRLEELGMKFMPFEEAIYFGKEHELPENKGIKTFCFHQAT
mgnify:FL=1